MELLTAFPATSPAHDLLQRLFNEQYVVMDGKAVLRDKKEVKADSLQNPNDPDATYRAKNDQQVLGYVTNITETVEEGKPNIITSVQVETAVFADCHLLQEAVEATGNTYEAVKAVTKQDAGKRQRIPWNNKTGWRYFEDKDIKAYRLRKQIESLPLEEQHKRNNVETAMFQYSFHTRNGKT